MNCSTGVTELFPSKREKTFNAKEISYLPNFGIFQISQQQFMNQKLIYKFAIFRLTPFDERTNSNLAESKASTAGARKKLGFAGLFDTSDPQIDDVDDVIGMCSGQFATQTQEKSQEGEGDTPDTLVMTNNELSAAKETQG